MKMPAVRAQHASRVKHCKANFLCPSVLHIYLHCRRIVFLQSRNDCLLLTNFLSITTILGAVEWLSSIRLRSSCNGLLSIGWAISNDVQWGQGLDWTKIQTQKNILHCVMWNNFFAVTKVYKSIKYTSNHVWYICCFPIVQWDNLYTHRHHTVISGCSCCFFWSKEIIIKRYRKS